LLSGLPEEGLGGGKRHKNHCARLKAEVHLQKAAMAREMVGMTDEIDKKMNDDVRVDWEKLRVIRAGAGPSAVVLHGLCHPPAPVLF
jgi:hypothetical protein